MEDVLDVYTSKQTSENPQQTLEVRLCFDERPCQLIGEVITPLPMQAGKPKREDYEYERQGTAVVLLAYDIDTGQRYVQVREQRTKKDYAQFMDWLVQQHYPQAYQIHIVQDNLNTHHAGSFYEHLPLERAYTLKNKFIFHYTPLHASWLNMAEIEFSALTKQCLDRRMASLTLLREEVIAWMQERNKKKVKIKWLFDTPKARSKLTRHYRKVNPDNQLCLQANYIPISDSNN